MALARGSYNAQVTVRMVAYAAMGYFSLQCFVPTSWLHSNRFAAGENRLLHPSIRTRLPSRKTICCKAFAFRTEAQQAAPRLEDEDHIAGSYFLHFQDGRTCSYVCDAGQFLRVALEEAKALIHMYRLQGEGRQPEEYSLSVVASGDSSVPALPGRPHLWALPHSVLEEPDVGNLAQRCVFLRAAYRPLACGTTVSEAAQRAEEVIQQWSSARKAQSWALSHVRGVHRGAKMSRADVLTAFDDAFSHLGSVDLDAPQIRLAVLEEYLPDARIHESAEEALPPHRIWFLEVLGERPSGWKSPYMLEKRPYISQTTTRPEVAFLLANLACVTHGTSVLDPVCGSAGLLLIAAACGATQLHGIDANPDALESKRSSRAADHRKKKGSHNISLTVGGTQTDSGIADNFAHLALPEPVLTCGDALDLTLPPYSENWDVILADLPYGWREYTLFHNPHEFAAGLLRMAARVLRRGGRAVMTWPGPLTGYAESYAADAGLDVVAVLRCDIHEKLRRSIVVFEQPGDPSTTGPVAAQS